MSLLARVLAIKPQILLMDEPFVSLDEAAADQLRKLTPNLWNTTRPTTLMATHNLIEAASMTDNVLILHEKLAGIICDQTLNQPREQRHGEWMRDIAKRLGDAIKTGKVDD